MLITLPASFAERTDKNLCYSSNGTLIKDRESIRLKIKIFNREICVNALLATNSFMSREQRRKEKNYACKNNGRPDWSTH